MCLCQQWSLSVLTKGISFFVHCCRVSYCDQGKKGSAFTELYTGKERTFKVPEKLQPGHAYSFRLRVVNEVGERWGCLYVPHCVLFCGACGRFVTSVLDSSFLFTRRCSYCQESNRAFQIVFSFASCLLYIVSPANLAFNTRPLVYLASLMHPVLCGEPRQPSRCLGLSRRTMAVRRAMHDRGVQLALSLLMYNKSFYCFTRMVVGTQCW